MQYTFYYLVSFEIGVCPGRDCHFFRIGRVRGRGLGLQNLGRTGTLLEFRLLGLFSLNTFGALPGVGQVYLDVALDAVVGGAGRVRDLEADGTLHQRAGARRTTGKK